MVQFVSSVKHRYLDRKDKFSYDRIEDLVEHCNYMFNSGWKMVEFQSIDGIYAEYQKEVGINE